MYRRTAEFVLWSFLILLGFEAQKEQALSIMLIWLIFKQAFLFNYPYEIVISKTSKCHFVLSAI